jgi:hypothetical protein
MISQNKWLQLRSDAHQAVYIAVKKGELPKQNTLKCTDCGKQARDYDHRDYTKPLDVEPVCRSCNQLRSYAMPEFRQPKGVIKNIMGLKNDKNINFRWDEKGFKLVARRAKANGLSKEAYLRYAVNLENDTRGRLIKDAE